ncbi:MAG: hypothetical protein IJ313_03910 [Clostridia bacterium]|nr:hypothetical protein [Clostridia bacterium]
MLSKIKNPRVQCALVLLALFGVQLLMHMNVDNLLLDDWAFYAVMETGESVPAWLLGRWNGWSSRLLIEAILCPLTHSIWAFRVLDSAVMVLMAWALSRLAGSEERPGMLALSAMLVTTIPFAILRSTGWMATSLNYYWPLAATAGALIPLADSLWGRETSRSMAAAAVLLSLLGANQEQTSAVIMGSYLVLGGWWAMKNRRINRVHLAIFAIAAVQLMLHLCCPGNGARSEASVAMVNLRDYGQFTLIDKLSIGLTSTTALLIYTYNSMLLACGTLTISTITARRRGTAAHLLAGAAALFVLRAFDAYFTVAVSGLAGVNRPFSTMLSYSLILGPQGVGDAAMRMAMLFLTVAVLGLMALSLYLSIGHRGLSAAAVFAFAIGFAARMALSFSPTVVESGERTMLPLYGAMMLCSLLCVRDCREDGSRRWPLVIAAAICAAIAGLNVLGSFALAA